MPSGMLIHTNGITKVSASFLHISLISRLVSGLVRGPLISASQQSGLRGIWTPMMAMSPIDYFKLLMTNSGVSLGTDGMIKHLQAAHDAFRYIGACAYNWHQKVSAMLLMAPSGTLVHVHANGITKHLQQMFPAKSFCCMSDTCGMILCHDLIVAVYHQRLVLS